jgi:oligopeptide transport system substrate-binding protein
MRLFLQVLCVTCGLILTSCTHQPSTPQKEVRLYFQAEPFSLDPRVGGDRRSTTVLRDLFEGLTRIGKEGKPELAVAQSVDISEDQKTYTFHLRQSQWSNGAPVTAYDFAWAWKSAIDPTFSTPFCYAFYALKNAKKAHVNECSIDDIGVKAVDARTLEVTLEHPTPYFLELLANPLFSPLCRSAIKKSPDWAASSSPTYVSNGPFLLKEHALKSHIILERNPSYWNPDCAKAPSISFCIVDDPNTAYSLFQKGELDWYGDPCGIIPLEIMGQIQKDLTKRQAGGLYWLVVCTEKHHLSSPKIRKAIATAINRQEIVQFLQCGEPAFTVLPKWLSMLEQPSFADGDTRAARALFAEGCAEMGIHPSDYPHIVLTHWSEPTTKAIVEIIQHQLQQALPITVDLEATDWATYMRRVPAGDIDIAAAPWTTWIADPMFNLEYLKFKGNGINGTCWQNGNYIDQLNKADASTDPQQRRDHMYHAELMAVNALPLIPLYSLTYQYMKQPCVHGELVSPVGAIDFKWVEKDVSPKGNP